MTDAKTIEVSPEPAAPLPPLGPPPAVDLGILISCVENRLWTVSSYGKLASMKSECDFFRERGHNVLCVHVSDAKPDVEEVAQRLYGTAERKMRLGRPWEVLSGREKEDQREWARLYIEAGGR